MKKTFRKSTKYSRNETNLKIGHLTKPIAHAKSSHFSNIWCFFERLFAQKKSNVLLRWILACFWLFQCLTQTDHFAKALDFAWAIGFGRWPIFKIVSFPEYLVFVRTAFCTDRRTVMLMWNSFCLVFGIFNFSPKLTILQRL